MKRNLVRATLVFVALLISGSSLAQNYPKPTGHVNDFADIILPEARQQLESRLRDYRDKTSIEVAVATVSSLDGQTVEDYGLKLFSSWGVGDKKKDNGILFLVAPNEGKVRIEVGYGMEPDLTDGRSGQILDQEVLPHFVGFRELQGSAQKQKLTDGIVSGVNAIIGHLGNMPFENRLEERRLAAEKRAAEQKKRDEEFDAFIKTAGVFAIPVIIIAIFVIAFYRSYLRKEELRRQHDKNKHDLDLCEKDLEKALKEHPEAKSQLGVLIGNPSEVWIDLEERLSQFPDGVDHCKQMLRDLYEGHDQGGFQKSKELSDQIETLQDVIHSYSSLLQDILNRIAKVTEAKTESPKLFASFSQLLRDVKDELEHKDVTKASWAFIDKADKKYKDAIKAGLHPFLNWLKVYALLKEAVSLAEQAKTSAKNEKYRAEEARRPKPVSRPSSYSSRSSGGGGGFGGFGGGRSGGGGASRSF